MIIQDQISKHQIQFEEICKNHHVKYLYAFGSSTNTSFDYQNSDLDLLVEVDVSDPIEKGETLISLWETFEKIFNRKIDLLTESSIKNPYLKKSIDSTKVLIYDREREKISG